MELEEDGSNAQAVSWEILHKHTEAKENNQGLRQEQHRLFTIYSSNNFLSLWSNFSLFCRSSYVLSKEVIVRLDETEAYLLGVSFFSSTYSTHSTYIGLHFWHVFKWTTLIDSLPSNWTDANIAAQFKLNRPLLFTCNYIKGMNNGIKGVRMGTGQL